VFYPEPHPEADVASSKDEGGLKMSSARLTVSSLWKFAALVLILACGQADAAAQDRPAVSVQSITVDGTSVKTVQGVRMIAPGQSSAERRELKEHDSLAPGTVIELPERTVVKLVTANGTEVTLQPNSRTKLNAVSDKGESFTQLLGETWFKVVRTLDFFEVTRDRFLAAVKGTEFKVAVDGRQIQFALGWADQGLSRRQLMIDGAVQRYCHSGRRCIAGNQRVSYQLGVDEYLRTSRATRTWSSTSATNWKKTKGAETSCGFCKGGRILGLRL
jgi:hypothetical protein